MYRRWMSDKSSDVVMYSQVLSVVYLHLPEYCKLESVEERSGESEYSFAVREETGRLSPPQSVTAFRLSSMVIGRCVPDYI